MNRLRVLVCYLFLFFFLPTTPLQSASGTRVAQIVRACNAALLWRAESAALRKQQELAHENGEIDLMCKDGTLTEREADAMRAEKKKEYASALAPLRWAHGRNASLIAFEEGVMLYNNRIEKGTVAGGALLGAGVIDEQRIGAWRKTRMLLLAAELLLGALQGRTMLGRDANGMAAQNRRISAFAILRRAVRLLHHYLVAGKVSNRVCLSYIAQVASIVAAFTGGDRQQAEQLRRWQYEERVARTRRNACVSVNPEPQEALSNERIAQLLSGQDQCPVCLEYFRKEYIDKDGEDKTFSSDDWVGASRELAYTRRCGHVSCLDCIKKSLVSKRRCLTCQQGVPLGNDGLGTLTDEQKALLKRYDARERCRG
ncbi:MAG: hypothetical protein PVJ92_00155 [Candidatus Dependentiae bacterium]|jgi:hypothetical protein